jgi:prophage antirepressor-like protein
MNEITTINGVECYEREGVAYLKLETVARGLGFTQEKNGIEYIRWETVNGFLTDLGFPNKLGKEDYIPENIFYRLAMKAKNAAAESFQAKVADEIIPAIRRTGGYQLRPKTPNEMFMLQAEINVENEKKLAALESRMDETEKRLTETTEIFRARTLDSKDTWTKEMNRQVNEIVEGYGLNHQGFRKRLYQLLEIQLGIDLERRRANYQKRLKAGGAMYKDWRDVSKLQVIAQDAKLRAAFELIVKQEAAAYAMSGRER